MVWYSKSDGNGSKGSNNSQSSNKNYVRNSWPGDDDYENDQNNDNNDMGSSDGKWSKNEDNTKRNGYSNNKFSDENSSRSNYKTQDYHSSSDDQQGGWGGNDSDNDNINDADYQNRGGKDRSKGSRIEDNGRANNTRYTNDNNWNGEGRNVENNEKDYGNRSGGNRNKGGEKMERESNRRENNATGNNDNNWNGAGYNDENNRTDNENRRGSDRNDGSRRKSNERENNSRGSNDNGWDGASCNDENDGNDYEYRSGSDTSKGWSRIEKEGNQRGNNDYNRNSAKCNDENDRKDYGNRSRSDRSESGERMERGDLRENNSRGNWNGGGRNNENDRTDDGNRRESDRNDGGRRRSNERENNSRGSNDNNWNGGRRNNENDRTDNENRRESDRNDGGRRRSNERENNSRGSNDNNWNNERRNNENDRTDNVNRRESDRNDGSRRRSNERENNSRGNNDGRDGGGRRKSYGSGDDNERESNAEDDENKSDGSDLPKKVEFYIPPELGNEESKIFSSGITTGINFNKFDDIKAEMNGNNLPTVISSFEEVNLNPLLMKNIKKSNYTKPTPIQKYAISVLTAQRDLMACAQTGSGKTAAFLIPILNSFLENPVDLVMDKEHIEPQAIIISPTRELAIQIYHEARKFSFDSNIKVSLIYGGVSTGYQRRCIDKGCHIMIATPGRLLDFVKRGWVTFSSIRFVVLDEADRMLGMGFIPAMEEMFQHPSMISLGQRRTLMFSATFPQDIQNLASQFLDNYIFVTVGIVGSASSDVKQIFMKVEQSEKRPKLIEVFDTHGTTGTLVFVETRRNADFLGIYLSEQNYKINSIHGDRSQREREEAITDFKTGKCDILVATSVAARGLDIQNVKHVINFDLPSDVDEYVHRVGRTGRIGNEGMATSFFDHETNSRNAEAYVKILEQSKQDVPDWLRSDRTTKNKKYSSLSFGGRDVRYRMGHRGDE